MCEAEKSEMDKLVPPSVIENMNKKISAIISNNEKIPKYPDLNDFP